MNKFIALLIFPITVHAIPLSVLIDRTSNTVIASKTQGVVYVYNKNEDKLTSSPALFGAKLGDDLDGKLHITPAGEFKAYKAYSAKLHEDITVFYKVPSALLAIHPVWLGNKQQNRPGRLASAIPDDNRITNGCINVPEDFYYASLHSLKNGTLTVKILREFDTVEDDLSGSLVKHDSSRMLYNESLIPNVSSTTELSGNSGNSGL